MITRKKVQHNNVRKTFLIIAIVFFAVSVAGFIVKNVLKNQTSILTSIDCGDSLQNSQVIYDEKNNRTYLGKYQNVVIALDENKKEIWKYEIGGSVSAMCLDENKDWILVGSQDRKVYIIHNKTGELIRSFGVNGRIYDIDYDSGSGKVLISAGVNPAKHWLYLFDANTGEELETIQIRSIAQGAKFSSDYNGIIYGEKRGDLVRLDLDGNVVNQVSVNEDIVDIEVASENGDIALVTFEGTCAVYDSNLKPKFSTKLVGEGRTVGIVENSNWIGAGTREGDVYFLNHAGEIDYSTRFSEQITQIYFNKDNSYVVPLSKELFQFGSDKLEQIKVMGIIEGYSFIIAIVSGVLALVFLVLAFPKGREKIRLFGTILHKHRTAYLMLVPSFALILVFFYWPILQAFSFSFTDWSDSTKTLREVKFVGMDNYVKMFTEGYFLLGTKNMFLILIFNLLKLLIPVLCAELVFSMKGKFGNQRRYLFRLLLVVPMVVPGVVNTLMWKNIYDPNIGLLNEIMKLFGLPIQSWLGNSSTAIWSIIFMGFPWVNSLAFLVFYGGLINISEELFEAAKVDGSNPIWNFFKIHLPLISPQIKMMVILTFISSIQDYGGILLLTNGGPGTATYVPGFEMYQNATSLGQYGYACAMGVVMFIFIMIVSIFNLRIKTADVN